jgi:hypothetical protein
MPGGFENEQRTGKTMSWATEPSLQGVLVSWATELSLQGVLVSWAIERGPRVLDQRAKSPMGVPRAIESSLQGVLLSWAIEPSLQGSVCLGPSSQVSNGSSCLGPITRTLAQSGPQAAHRCVLMNPNEHNGQALICVHRGSRLRSDTCVRHYQHQLHPLSVGCIYIWAQEGGGSGERPSPAINIKQYMFELFGSKSVLGAASVERQRVEHTRERE